MGPKILKKENISSYLTSKTSLQYKIRHYLGITTCTCNSLKLYVYIILYETNTSSACRTAIIQQLSSFCTGQSIESLSQDKPINLQDLVSHDTVSVMTNQQRSYHRINQSFGTIWCHMTQCLYWPITLHQLSCPMIHQLLK